MTTVFVAMSGLYVPGIVLGAIAIVQIKAYRNLKASLVSNLDQQQKLLSSIFDQTILYLMERWKQKTQHMIKTFNQRSPTKQVHQADNDEALKGIGDEYDKKDENIVFRRAYLIFTTQLPALPTNLIECCKKVSFGADALNLSQNVDSARERNKGYVKLKVESNHPVAYVDEELKSADSKLADSQ